jgi:type IV pilus assembly protein PilC
MSQTMELSTFTFKALDLSGVSTRGEVEAENKQHVASQLRARGLIVIDIEEKKAPSDIGDMLGRFKRVKSQELTVASRQLSTMISSGMSLLRALYVLEEQADNDKLRDALTSVRKDVEAGISFAEALGRHPAIFNELYVAMVAAGETGGILEETLRRVADQLEKDDSLRRQVKAAMMYPSMIGGFALVVLVALVVFLVPVFEKIFKDFGGELPAVTKFTVALSDLLTKRFYLVIIAAVGITVGFKRWKASERGREQWDRFKLRIPWKIGDIVQKVCLARFSRTYSALIAAGVPMLQAIEITGKTAGNKVVEKAMAAVSESVKAGGTIAAPMRDEPSAFPLMVTQMIAVGEETGALESMLSKVADR